MRNVFRGLDYPCIYEKRQKKVRLGLKFEGLKSGFFAPSGLINSKSSSPTPIFSAIFGGFGPKLT